MYGLSVDTVPKVREVRKEGKNSTIIAIHPDFVKQLGLQKGSIMSQRITKQKTLELKLLNV